MVRNEELKNFAVSSSWLGCKSGVLTCVTEDFDPNLAPELPGLHPGFYFCFLPRTECLHRTDI